jgi:hypothetical protein
MIITLPTKSSIGCSVFVLDTKVNKDSTYAKDFIKYGCTLKHKLFHKNIVLPTT